VAEPLFPHDDERAGPHPRPALGYAMVATAATLWALNGVVSKVILTTNLSSPRLSEVRSTGALLGLALALLIVRPAALRIRRDELLRLIIFGVCGLAFVQWFYFFAIHRLPIAVSLIIQYTAPVLVALWARYVGHERVRSRIWVALALALAGLTLVVQLWSGFELDTLGALAAVAAAFAFALYILMAEHGVGRRDPVSLVCLGFLFAAIFWAIVQPWWSFPDGIVGDSISLGGNLADTHLPVWSLMAWMIVLGTIAPFGLLVAALRHVPATGAGIVAMLEPVAAAIVAWAWLDESLDALQLLGGAVVLGAIILAQTAR
jgi:drug/metabolite transporter (DMT)-like permease